VNFLLLEIALLILVDEDQIEIILERELVVDVAVGWGQIEWTQKEADWNRLSSDRRAVHDLELGECLVLIVEVGP